MLISWLPAAAPVAGRRGEVEEHGETRGRHQRREDDAPAGFLEKREQVRAGSEGTGEEDGKEKQRAGRNRDRRWRRGGAALVSGEADPTRHGGRRRGAQEEQDAWLGGSMDLKIMVVAGW